MKQIYLGLADGKYFLNFRGLRDSIKEAKQYETIQEVIVGLPQKRKFILTYDKEVPQEDINTIKEKAKKDNHFQLEDITLDERYK